ncbi:MAG: bifunctional [glutamate--ammonia ligase]-adenylyl-L-tyrosine phosphorylase/[glutamate--ammonia-ligase] adenylyltransferase [Succinivibrio sp.]
MTYDIIPKNTSFDSLPEILKNEGLKQFERLKAHLSEEQFSVFSDRDDFLYVLALSDFVANTIFSYPKECCALLQAGSLDKNNSTDDFSEVLNSYLSEKLSEFELKKRLRILRRTRCMVIAWRDLIGSADIDETFYSLSTLAEQIVLKTLSVCRAQVGAAYGDALCEDGTPMPLLTLGMGKLGGGELNFSSDIDLIFAYPYEGETKGKSLTLTHREFFSRIVQRSANLLSDKTVDTFCYRIDLRLRPFGDAGAIVNSFDALQIYYETQGRTWERYALVKAKLLGDKSIYGDFGDELISLLRPFVYRRYLDYGAVQSLRKLKHMIEAEVRRRSLKNNFKLGEGGIREIEFIAQVFELMRGGRFVELRERSLRKTLRHIQELELLPANICEKLDKNYVFLRRLENVIQEFSDRQTQTLPENEKDTKRMLVAMNYSSLETFMHDLDEVMNCVHNEFRQVVADEREDSVKIENFDLWEANFSEEELALELEKYLVNKDQSKDLSAAIINLKHSLSRMPVGPVGRETLLELMPKVILLISKEEQSATLFKRIAGLIEQVALRTPYMQLLRDNNLVLERFIILLKENHYASELITSHPILLDELFIPQYFEAPPSADEFFAMLQERLLRIPQDDLEAVMEELRLFKKIMVFRVALSDKAGKLPLMKISDALTWLAEAIVRQLVILSWEQCASKYGVPPGRSVSDPGLAIIGYGKLGGIELGYKSDLDMVFIRQVSEEKTDGENPVSVDMFYQRLVQRLLHLSTTKTIGGVLYDLDMRLRPDGDTGLLISDVDSFEKYQEERAWTWEHQALVRARPVAGSADIITKFNAIRDRILRKSTDTNTLKKEVVMMREKMRTHLDRSSDSLYDIKQGSGGMIDVEFISQYLLLNNAHSYPSMKLWSDNVRILEECSALGIVDKKISEDLIKAYIDIRKIYHELSLADLPRLIKREHRLPMTFEVEKIWNSLFDGVKAKE